MRTFCTVRLAAFLIAIAAVAARACLGQAAPQPEKVSARIVWLEGAPQVQVSVATEPPAGVSKLPVQVSVFNKEGRHVWQGAVVVPLEKGKPFTASAKLPNLGKDDVRFRVTLSAQSEPLGIEYAETLHGLGEKSGVQSHGVRREGRFPQERVWLVLQAHGMRGTEGQEAPLGIVVRDGGGTAIIDRVEKLVVGAEPQRYLFDVTPDRQSVGPYSLECSIESEATGISFTAEQKFGYADALVPVSSMETDDRTWSTTSQVWPSDDYPVGYPVITYDSQEAHGGRQSLRMDYVEGDETGGSGELPYGPGRGQGASIYGTVVLPGLPTAARIWVKGNGSSDQLVITWRDNYDIARPHWLRWPNYSSHSVCTLDFKEWRCFRVPVLGEGLQKPSPLGSTEDVDAPVFVYKLEVRTNRAPQGRVPERRSVWIDDLGVETQAPAGERMSMEVRGDEPQRRLSQKSAVFVCIGNGLEKEIADGRLHVMARDRAGNVLFQQTQPLQVPAQGFAVAQVPLAEAAAKSPAGPVDVDATFSAPAVPGMRASRRLVWRNPKSKALVWDFEKPGTYSGFQKPYPPAVASASQVTGGALRVKVDPAKGGGVLLHPALPGVVDEVEVMVRGGERPVVLTPVLLDSGNTGNVLKGFNSFPLPPMRVDWRDWRKVTLVAPPVPAGYEDKARYFLNMPYYPLNLAFDATVERKPDEKPAEGEQPVYVEFDNIVVTTHLLPEEELGAVLDFPDDSRVHAPGAPLEVVLTNFAAADKALDVTWRLQRLSAPEAKEGRLAVNVPAGRRVVQKLVPALEPGLYVLTVGLPKGGIEEHLAVLDARKVFGDSPLVTLDKLPELRRLLGMTDEMVYLDWDNTEPVPGFFNYHWFDAQCRRASAGGAYNLMPVVGFCADWAGPHAQDAVSKGAYSRFMGNILQVPVHMEDWSRFVRETLREFGSAQGAAPGRFSHWVFWENPDLEGAPQSIPPELYPQMLDVFQKWVKMYDPKARVVAGGFNIDKALPYLSRFQDPAALKFDEISVQVNLGELSPEQGDLEGFLDDLNALLKLPETGRRVQTTQLDWPVGRFVSATQQAAYHTRALLILNSRGADAHRFPLVGSGQSFEGPGILYRTPYGTSEVIQHLKSTYSPKPAYFALAHARSFLSRWKFERSVVVPDFNLDANRAFIYRGAEGRAAVAAWRAVGEPRLYTLPPAWKDARAVDAFGMPLSLTGGLRLSSLPVFIELPPSCAVEQAAHELRVLRPADGHDVVVLDLHAAEPDSAGRAAYQFTGKGEPKPLHGRAPGGVRVKDTFLFGLQGEQFEFELAAPADVLLTRCWQFDGEGGKLALSLNGGPEMPWDLTKGQGNAPGVRCSTYVLRGCKAGKNTVKVRYEAPGNCAGYRAEVLEKDYVDLARWGVLNAMQSRGELQAFASAVGTPLKMGKTAYASGLGSHAVALIECPLDGQFSAFEVTVGVDAVTDGRGSVSFHVLVDGAEKASSGVLNGFSDPKVLRVEGIEGARRMMLVVKDAGDKNQDDVADWADGKLFLKPVAKRPE